MSGPTPPGTGEIQPATSRTASKSTSPTSRLLPSCSMRLMPTSITTAPGFTMSAVIRFGRPTAATRMSARRVWSARFSERLWQSVTVASPPCPRRPPIVGLLLASRSASGLPTMSLRPTITAWRPAVCTSASISIRCTPAAVQGMNRGRPCESRPAFSGWKPSTSRSGGTASRTATVSTCFGSGSCTRIPSAGPWASRAIPRTSATSAAVSVSAGTRITSASIPTRSAAAALLFTYEPLAAMSPTSTTTSRGRRRNMPAKVSTSARSDSSMRPASARPSRSCAVMGPRWCTSTAAGAGSPRACAAPRPRDCRPFSARASPACR